jgi:hypothetical protein
MVSRPTIGWPISGSPAPQFCGATCAEHAMLLTIGFSWRGKRARYRSCAKPGRNTRGSTNDPAAPPQCIGDSERESAVVPFSCIFFSFQNFRFWPTPAYKTTSEYLVKMLQYQDVAPS